MPFSAARPAWSGLVMVPNPSRIPDERLAAMPSAMARSSASSPASLAAVAQAPSVPMVAVEWKPSR